MTDTQAVRRNPRSNETSRPRHLLRRIGAVLAGLLVVVSLDVSIDVIMHATGIYPPWFKPMSTQLWMLAIGYRTVDGVLASYVVARLAPDRPLRHALVFGLIGVVMSIAGVIGTWSKGPEFGPKWYPLVLVAIALPCAWVGGKLRERQIKSL
jgi:peptidoglycan/LPS O-acetylase OafA/YrhL